MRREPYDEAYKAEIVRRVLAGETAEAISRQPGSPRGATIREWVVKAKHKEALKATVRQHVEPRPVVLAPTIEAHRPRRVLVIPDMHHPFCHPDALEFLKAVRDAYKCDSVVCLGDEVDWHALSRYDHDPDGLSPGGELEAALVSIAPFYTAFPDVLVCTSNHTVRGHRKAYSAGIPAAFLKHISMVLHAPDGWEWRDEHRIDGVSYIHGDAGRSGQYAHIHYMKQAKRSVVIGHIHAFAGVAFEGQHFGMNTGCLIDSEAYAFAYGRKNLLPVSLGCGVVIEGREAHFIPMHLDDNKRWTGKL
ncbi:metallophosphoesterase [Tautonia marina]|uniref:metallophosphoesterase n=1 Tax=Tautonia marina TaxID=2653855 RepID=UPI00126133C0|nr:metallophosphoesterase [Tautonia marina]